MLRNIIFIVFIYPLIMFILGLVKQNTKKEKFIDTLYLSKIYQTICHVAALIFAVMGIVLGLLFGFQETIAHDILFAVCIILIEVCAVMFKRHKVRIKDDTLCMTPLIGRTREVKFNEITRFKEKEGIGIKVYLKKKKVCTISCDCVGYKQFIKILKERKML